MTELSHPDDGCYFHGREPIPPGCYRVCGECGHAYATPEDLLAAEREAVDRLNELVDSLNAASEQIGGGRLEYIEFADGIHFCPLCTHDW